MRRTEPTLGAVPALDAGTDELLVTDCTLSGLVDGLTGLPESAWPDEQFAVRLAERLGLRRLWLVAGGGGRDDSVRGAATKAAVREP